MSAAYDGSNSASDQARRGHPFEHILLSHSIDYKTSRCLKFDKEKFFNAGAFCDNKSMQRLAEGEGRGGLGLERR